MTRKTFYVSFSYLTGLLAASFFVLRLSFSVAAIFILAGAGIILIIKPDRGSKTFRGAVCMIFLSVGLVHYGLYDIAVCRPIQENDGKKTELSAEILSAEHYSSGSSFYTVKAVLPNGKKGKVGFYVYKDERLVRGDRITVSGTLSKPVETEFSDSADYYGSTGVFILLKDVEVIGNEIKENSIFRIADNFRLKTARNIRKALDGIFDDDAAEFVIGILFGGRVSNMSESAERPLYRAGIGHITAVSGMHMTIVTGMTAAVFSAVGLPKRRQLLLLCLSAVTFAVIADFTFSVMRSLIMLMFVYAARAVNRQSDSMTSLAAALVIITLPSPFSVRNTGLILSASGVVGTAGIAPVLERTAYKRFGNKSAILSPIITAFCAYGAVFPAAVFSFDEVSVISPLANILLSPFFTIAACGAAMGAVIGTVPFMYVLSAAFYKVSGVICALILKGCRLVSEMPVAAVPSGLEIAPPLIVIGIISVICAAAIMEDKIYTALVFAASVLICSAALTAYMLVPSDKSCITVLTEGKGCILILHSDNYSAVLDFIGSKSGVNAAKSYIRRFGIAEPETVLTFKSSDKTAISYENSFPKANVISSPEESFLYFGEYKIEINDGYIVISDGRADIICVYDKCNVPVKTYSLAVYSCKKCDVVSSNAYVVARNDFEGTIPPAALLSVCHSQCYEIYGSSVYVSEKSKWLRLQ